MSSIPGYLTSEEAASVLGITRFRVAKLMRNKQLDGVKVGKTWLIEESSVNNRLNNPPKNGRPKSDK